MKFSSTILFYFAFFLIHLTKLGWLVSIPAVYFYISSFVNKVFQYRPAFIVYVLLFYSFIQIIVKTGFQNLGFSAVLDAKLLMMFGIFLFFFSFSRFYKVNINYYLQTVIASLFLYFLLFYLIQGNLVNFVLIRGDIGAVVIIAFCYLIPFSKEQIKKNIIWIFLGLLLMAIFQGRASILVGCIILGYFIYISLVHKAIEKKIFSLYLFLFATFLMVAVFIFSSRAFDISESFSGITVIESEARLMALYVLYEVLNKMTISEIIFGNGLGVDYSQNIQCNLKFVCLHMQNIMTGNQGIYPAIGFHNEWIRIFVTFGIVGIVLTFAFFYYLWAKIRIEDSVLLKQKKIRFQLLLISSVCLMFSHGVLGTTITGFIILSTLALGYSDIQKESKLRYEI